MHSWRTIPDKIRKLIQDEASAVNLPRIGCDENVAFTAIQVNVSAAEPYTPPPPARKTLARSNVESTPALPERRATRQTESDDTGIEFIEPDSARSAYAHCNFFLAGYLFSSQLVISLRLAHSHSHM